MSTVWAFDANTVLPEQRTLYDQAVVDGYKRQLKDLCEENTKLRLENAELFAKLRRANLVNKK